MRLGSWLEIAESDDISFERLKATLEVPNPEYLSAVQQGFSTAGMARMDPLYQESHRQGERTLLVPRALVNLYGRGKDVVDERSDGFDADMPLKLALGPTDERKEDQTAFVDAVVKAATARAGAIGQASPGYGKQQALDSLLWTEQGLLLMEDVRVGDRIYGADGLLHTVTGVFPQGMQKSYRVTFTDGSSVEAGMEHLWTVQSDRSRRQGGRWKTKTLRDIVDSGLVSSDGHTRWYVPMTQPIQFPKQLYAVAPYALGCLLADGSFVGGVSWSNMEADVRERLQAALPDGCSLGAPRQGKDHYVRGFMQYARILGLAGVRSWEKSVPKQYLYGAVEDRLALLRGLFDCDGSVTCAGKQLEYTTSSWRLAMDVQFLVESLGGTARKARRTTKYTYKGEKKEGRPSYRLTLLLPDGYEPFSSEKHTSRYTKTGRYQPRRAIKSVEYSGLKPMQCISVDAPDQLYLTDHCIVTHNTLCALAAAAKLGRTTAVLVHKSFLMNQWVERIEQALDIDPRDIGFVQQDRCEFRGKKIVLLMAQSLLAREYDPDLYTYFGTVVVDEVHRFGAVEFRKVITKFPAKYRIGVTATPDRRDGLQEVFFKHIGEIAHVGSVPSLKARVKFVTAKMAVTDSMLRGMTSRRQGGRRVFDLNKVTQYVVDCETRNRQIVKLLYDALRAGRKVLVLSSRREHLTVIADLFDAEMPKQHARYSHGYYVGGMAERDLRITATRPLILATFQMAQEGLDIPDLDTLFLVTPKGDIVQAVGRILRQHSEKRPPLVIDFVEPQIPMSASLMRKRAGMYREMGCILD